MFLCRLPFNGKTLCFYVFALLTLHQQVLVARNSVIASSASARPLSVSSCTMLSQFPSNLIFGTSYAFNKSRPSNFVQNCLFLSKFLWLLICPQCRVWKKIELFRLCKHVGQHLKSHRFASFFFCCIVVCNNRLFGSWSVWESVFRVGTCSVDRESSVVVNTGILCIIRIRLSFCNFFIGTIWLPVIIEEVVLAFDTPVIQDLSFIGAQIVKEFDGTNRIFTALGNSNTPANGSSLIQKGFFYLIFS